MLNMPHPRHGQHQACTPRKSCNRGSENSVARREIGDGRCAYPSSKRHEWNVVDGWNSRGSGTAGGRRGSHEFSDRQAAPPEKEGTAEKLSCHLCVCREGPSSTTHQTSFSCFL